jgi:chitinase
VRTVQIARKRMRKWKWSWSCALFPSLLLCALAMPSCRPEQRPRIVGYFSSWSIYGPDYHVADVPAHLLTHLAYAFAEVSAAGECALGDPWADVEKPYPEELPDADFRGSFGQLQLLRQAHPELRTLIAVGGWTGSARFSQVAATRETRRRFARSCVAFARAYGFDGIDIDWEYPVGGGLAGNGAAPEDRENLTLLLAALRAELDAAGGAEGAPHLLTIAAPATPSLLAHFELERLHDHVDWIHLMAYDLAGEWSATTGFHAPLFDDGVGPAGGSADDAVQALFDAGIPARKIVLGLPFYGRAWHGVANEGEGLYQPHGGVPMGTWEPGSFDYWDLADRFLATAPTHRSPEAGVPWLYDPAAGLMISYDDADSIAGKAGYARGRGLGGVMFWDLSADDEAATLATAAHRALAPRF